MPATGAARPADRGRQPRLPARPGRDRPGRDRARSPSSANRSPRATSPSRRRSTPPASTRTTAARTTRTRRSASASSRPTTTGSASTRPATATTAAPTTARTSRSSTRTRVAGTPGTASARPTRSQNLPTYYLRVTRTGDTLNGGLQPRRHAVDRLSRSDLNLAKVFADADGPVYIGPLGVNGEITRDLRVHPVHAGRVPGPVQPALGPVRGHRARPEVGAREPARHRAAGGGRRPPDAAARPR